MGGGGVRGRRGASPAIRCRAGVHDRARRAPGERWARSQPVRRTRSRRRRNVNAAATASIPCHCSSVIGGKAVTAAVMTAMSSADNADDPLRGRRARRAPAAVSPVWLVLVVLVLDLLAARLLPGGVASWASTSSVPRVERDARAVRLVCPLRPRTAPQGRADRPVPSLWPAPSQRTAGPGPGPVPGEEAGSSSGVVVVRGAAARRSKRLTYLSINQPMDNPAVIRSRQPG